MKNKDKKKKIQKRITDNILSVVIVSILFIICCVSYIRHEILMKDSNMTVAVVLSISEEPGIRWGYQVSVLYSVNKIKYLKIVPVSSNDYNIGEKYLIRYSMKDPSISEVIWSEKVADESWILETDSERKQSLDSIYKKEN